MIFGVLNPEKNLTRIPDRFLVHKNLTTNSAIRSTPNFWQWIRVGSSNMVEGTGWPHDPLCVTNVQGQKIKGTSYGSCKASTGTWLSVKKMFNAPLSVGLRRRGGNLDPASTSFSRVDWPWLWPWHRSGPKPGCRSGLQPGLGQSDVDSCYLDTDSEPD